MKCWLCRDKPFVTLYHENRAKLENKEQIFGHCHCSDQLLGIAPNYDKIDMNHKLTLVGEYRKKSRHTGLSEILGGLGGLPIGAGCFAKGYAKRPESPLPQVSELLKFWTHPVTLVALTMITTRHRPSERLNVYVCLLSLSEFYLRC